LTSGCAAAYDAVVSPTPEPISTQSGAWRPNHASLTSSGAETPSTASAPKTQAAAWRSQASACRAVKRLPRRE